jgi:hypothetical protein
MKKKERAVDARCRKACSWSLWVTHLAYDAQRPTVTSFLPLFRFLEIRFWSPPELRFYLPPYGSKLGNEINMKKAQTRDVRVSSNFPPTEV